MFDASIASIVPLAKKMSQVSMSLCTSVCVEDGRKRKKKKG